MTTRRLMEELRGRAGGQPAAPRPTPRREREPLPRPSRPAAAPAGISTARGQGAGSDPARGKLVPHPPRSAQRPALLSELKAATPAKIGIGRAGLRYRTETALQFLADFAVAQAAVQSQIPDSWAEAQGYLALQTEAADPEEFLTRPDKGRQLAAESLARLTSQARQAPDVQIVIGDGLSATAVEQNAPPMVQVLQEELARQGRTLGTPVFVRHCRAKIADIVGQAVGAKVALILIGERPGLGTGDGMSAYLVWNPQEERHDAEKQAISNIHRRGLLPEDAGRYAARVIAAILEQQTSGVKLDLSGVAPPQSERQRLNQVHPEPQLGCGQSHGQSCERCESGLPGAVCGRSEDRPCAVSTH